MIFLRRRPYLAILLGCCLCFWASQPASAHVGDPTVYFEGTAGLFPLSVSVRTPGVVPGLAEISIRLKNNPEAGSLQDAEQTVQQVTVRPVRWDAGLDGAPPADVAQPVRGETGLYSAELWLMTPGSYSVYVEVTATGDDGEVVQGTAIVPVQSVATERLAMPPWLGSVLALLGLLLIAGLIRIAGAGTDSTRQPGESLGPQHRQGMRRSMIVATLFIGLVLYGGKTWWDAVDAGYLASIFETFAVEASVRVETTEISPEVSQKSIDPAAAIPATRGSQRILRLDLTDERWFEAPSLAPDHGKLMHLFLIREPELDVFAHLHPISRLNDEQAGFEVSLPPLPAGTYEIYADVTFETGFAQTLTAKVELPSPPTGPIVSPPGLEPDPDDSFRLAQPTTSPATATPEHTFDDGHRMLWQRPPGPLRADQEAELRFTLVDADGNQASLEAYMGMMSHAAVRRHDGGVFVHLHPTGTISMASQRVFERRQSERRQSKQRQRDDSPVDGGSADGDAASQDQASQDQAAHPIDHAAMGHTMIGWDQTTGTVSLPYAFPSPGTFRVWVQVKSVGQVYTGVFEAEVEDAEAE